MSYQDIYKGMVKKASAEQIKELAGMIKNARMNKEAAPGLISNAFKAGLRGGRDFGKKVFYTTGKAFRNHPIAATGTALTLGSIPFATYGAGVSSQAGATVRAERTADKLLAENKKLKSQGWFEHLLRSFGEWWEKVFGSKESASTPVTTKK